MLVSENIKPTTIATDLAGDNVESVIAELAELAARDSNGLDKFKLYENLMRRERLLSTAMGAGLAFPHCTIGGISSPLFVLGISRRGVDADAPDGQPVRIFFAVVSPERDPNAHLDALAAASRVFSDAAVRDAVLKAGDPEEVIAAIAASERDQ